MGQPVDAQIKDPSSALMPSVYPLGTPPPASVGGVCITGIPSGKISLRNLAATVTSVKGAQGILYGIVAYNASAATAFLQVFDKAAPGGVTLGSTVPDMEFSIAAGGMLQIPFPDEGVLFSNGMQVASTTTAGGATGSAAGVNVTPLFL